ncbi:MAG TPA: hypothetical protein VLF66_11435, partial [Thermoanaerobaculia bacterium]|nr:hypothetical protein [Thermoanaerobaculia bacterium]
GVISTSFPPKGVEVDHATLSATSDASADQRCLGHRVIRRLRRIESNAGFMHPGESQSLVIAHGSSDRYSPRRSGSRNPLTEQGSEKSIGIARYYVLSQSLIADQGRLDPARLRSSDRRRAGTDVAIPPY